MIDLSVCITAHNEEQRLPALFDSLKGIKDIVLIDFESTDKTGQLAKELGARVYKAKNAYFTSTKDDIKLFEQRYGFTPSFTDKQHHLNREVDRNYAHSQALNDWIYFPDCDEIVTWDLEEIKKLLPNNDKILYKFVNNHNPDGSELQSFIGDKLYRKSKFWWVDMLHEALNGHNFRQTWTDKMVVNHYRKEKLGDYLSRLEYAFLKTQSARMAYYLGREYFLASENVVNKYEYYMRCIQFLTIYLPMSSWEAQKQKAYQILARCMWNLGREEEAQNYVFQAIKINPNNKESVMLMSNMSRPKNAIVWQKFAETTTPEVNEV